MRALLLVLALALPAPKQGATVTVNDRELLTGVLSSVSRHISGGGGAMLPSNRQFIDEPEPQPEVEGAVADPELAGQVQAAQRSAGQEAPAGAVVDAPAGSVEQQVEWFLAGLRQHESGNRNVNSKVSSASGFYQYIDSTWNGYGGYRRAHEAPFEVQHRRAKEDAMRAFQAYGNWQDVAMAHFYPRFAGNRNLWHMVPGEERGKAYPGNPTGQAYVNSVMSKMQAAGG